MNNHNPFVTHRIENQPEPLTNYNAWQQDQALQSAVQSLGGGWAADHLQAYGELVGGELMALAVEANQNRPRFLPFDGYGRRIDRVEFHPAYHALMSKAMAFGLHSFAWQHPDKAGAHVARAALLYLGYQADSGICCPMSMTYAALPALKFNAVLAVSWGPKLTALQYDSRELPMAAKVGCTVGMGMTEKQGGSDVRTNTTRALKQANGSYTLLGHKWFFSAPMSDAHLVLAQAEAGLSCFLVPRLLADGSRNRVAIQRLKDKLGDWSNASSEVEFQEAVGLRVGEEGRGIATILEMVALTRLDCLTCSAGLMRQALLQAVHHCRQRKVFGRLLIDQPIMANVLADMALESEAAVLLAMRVAHAVDAAAHNPQEAALARITTALGKYWVCKRTPMLVNEALECLGGIGYVEDTPMPRLYRQAPLNSIWEGAGNVQCLDVLRALRREPLCGAVLFTEFDRVRGENRDLDQAVQQLKISLEGGTVEEAECRLLVEQIALALQATLMLQYGERDLADAFCSARLGEARGRMFGAARALPVRLLLQRVML
ncbi:isovaleryl-CoA dehydrogenase [Halioxenophilus sp. WMMB6]|uniref:isovaleryl-CoA dehydrogenase n=1 Tax=Halioxenophilus sp. WMMB6 TaxID=3073815 RepID=UPI00295F172C|nr:isovaleryl-CoA dehydrogenase [Halioxenophilus sp. WMMB6]